MNTINTGQFVFKAFQRKSDFFVQLLKGDGPHPFQALRGMREHFFRMLHSTILLKKRPYTTTLPCRITTTGVSGPFRAASKKKRC
jgi:hypothetical protein